MLIQIVGAVLLIACCQVLVFKASDNRMDGKLDAILKTSGRIETGVDSLLSTHFSDSMIQQIKEVEIAKHKRRTQ